MGFYVPFSMLVPQLREIKLGPRAPTLVLFTCEGLDELGPRWRRVSHQPVYIFCLGLVELILYPHVTLFLCSPLCHWQIIYLYCFLDLIYVRYDYDEKY